MKTIPLTKGYQAIVDDEDYEKLSQWKWFAHRGKSTFYAERKMRNPLISSQSVIRMHRIILEAPSCLHVDHINGNGLDNRRENIRLCTNAQNAMNQRMSKSSTTLMKGVSWRSSKNKFEAAIRVRGKSVYLGAFPCLTCAALAYDMAAVEHFGEFARTNILSAPERKSP